MANPNDPNHAYLSTPPSTVPPSGHASTQPAPSGPAGWPPPGPPPSVPQGYPSPAGWPPRPGVPLATTGPPGFMDVSEERKKIRTASIVNLVATLVQMACSVAIICIVRYNLEVMVVTSSGGVGSWSYRCYMGPPDQPGACQYAYSVASVSIFWCFILSLMQCLTMDCCGAGRLVEVVFDGLAVAWWIAGAVTLNVTSNEAAAAGVPRGDQRGAVIGLAWVSAAMFLVLMATNTLLVVQIGKAYRKASQQAQQQMAAMGAPHGGAGVQMMPYPYGSAPQQYPQQMSHMPPGYPAPPAGAYAAPPPSGYPPAPASGYGLQPPSGYPAPPASQPPPAQPPPAQATPPPGTYPPMSTAVGPSQPKEA